MFRILLILAMCFTSVTSFAETQEHSFEELMAMTSDQRFLAQLNDEELMGRIRLFSSLSIASCTLYPAHTIINWALASALVITVSEAQILVQRLGLGESVPVEVPSYGEIMLGTLPFAAANLSGALCAVMGENARLVSNEAIKRGLVERDTRSQAEIEWGIVDH